MFVKYGLELESYATNSLSQITNKRDCIEPLHQYITSPNDRKLCCLYGLRRTGKTITALQEIREIADYENTIYIVCDPGDTITALRNEIDKFLENKTSKCVIFIDEVTVISNFISTSACFVNCYSMVGTKVILLGTDSLAFWIAKNDPLYDRIHLIHTTYISYREYNRVLGKDLDDYLKHGGTLSPYTFSSRFEAESYTQTAIIDNIKNTLQHWNNGFNIASRILSEVIDNDTEFKSMISKVIEFPGHDFLAKIINNPFNSHDLKSMTDLVSRRKEIPDIEPLRTDAFVNRVRIFLEIQEQHFHTIEPLHVETIIEYLTVMDVLMKLPKVPSLCYDDKDEYIFTQVGLKYIQLLQQLLALRTSEEFIQFTPEHQVLITSILEENILGNLLEDVIIGQLIKEFWEPDAVIPEYEFSKYTNIVSKEIDIVAINHKLQSLVLFEVKHAKTRDEQQFKHLADSEFCKEIEAKTGMHIKNKVVVYRGESVIETKTENIVYLNAGEFLCHSDSWLPILFTVDCFTHPDEITEIIPTFHGVSVAASKFDSAIPTHLFKDSPKN